MEHLFESQLELPLAREAVFAFFAKAENLQKITPPELGFDIVTPLPIQIRTGALIEYRLRLFGVPFSWQTRISSFDPPQQFVDEQLRGPYRLWIHTHTFQSTPAGTLILDRVQYRLPFFPFGEVAYPVVRAQLRRIFQYRREAVITALMG